MVVLDFRILFVIPFALSEVFLIWTLWNLLQQTRKKKSHTPSRLLSDFKLTSPAQKQMTAQVFSFPNSSSVTSTMSRTR
jgi:hypothetical protein